MFEANLYDPRRNILEERIRLCDGYHKIFKMLTKPTLQGSEKQVAWANKIRDKKADVIAYEIVSKKISNQFSGDYDIDKLIDVKRKEFLKISASYWIDNRF